MDWQELYGNWVLIPDRPVAIIHFLGGAFVATAPQLTYRRLLERLALEGYAIIATPFINTFDHTAIAQTVYRNCDRALDYLFETTFRRRYLPIYGIGHSMGCKLHLLIGSQFAIERAGNILISYNNYAAKDAVPLVEQVSSVFSQVAAAFSEFVQADLSQPFAAVEFTPSPLETTRMISERYQVKRNLLVRFRNDTIDQSQALTEVLQIRFPGMIAARTLAGNHLTPLGPDVTWQSGAVFTPVDAIAQWMRQGVYQELHELERTIIHWLNPTGLV
jgi:Protein of unknown function (DUF1350)